MGSLLRAERILPHAEFIHKRFNTAFTDKTSRQQDLFPIGCTRSRFSRLHLAKVLSTA